jgi:hypothetical protein
MRLAPLAAAAGLGLASLTGCAAHQRVAVDKGNTSVHGGSDSSDDKSSTTEHGASTTVTTIHYTGDAHSSFCTMLGQADDGTVTQDTTRDAATVRDGMTRYRTQLEELDAAAPDVIQPDVHLIAKGVADLDDALRSVGYRWDDLSSADNVLEVQSEINDPDYTTAGAHVTAYRTQVCHL